MAWVLPAGGGPVVMAGRWPSSRSLLFLVETFQLYPLRHLRSRPCLRGLLTHLFSQYVVRAYCVPDMDQMLGPG